MKTEKPPLNVLMVEDSEDDATLLQIELERSGYELMCQRVDTVAALNSALDSQKWDLIIADYAMPRFDGLAALELVKKRSLDLPFIIVSGAITDDKAVAAMKAGAHDYVMKDNLKRLGPAVQRELRDAEVRQARRRSEATLKAESTFRRAIEDSMPAGITAVDLVGCLTYVNPAFCDLVGWNVAELIGTKPPFVFWPPDQIETITKTLEQVIQGRAPDGGVELPFRRHDGERIQVLMLPTPLKDAFGNVTGWVNSVSNITERKRAEQRVAAEHAITRILSDAPSIDEAAPGVVQVLLDTLEVDCGALWMPDPQHRILCPALMIPKVPSVAINSFIETGWRLELPAGCDLPGRVWQEHRAMWLEDLQADCECQCREAAIAAGLQSAVAFPIEAGGTFFGVIELFGFRRMEHDSTLTNMMAAIGAEMGQFAQRRNAEEALRQAKDELELRVQQRTAELNTAYANLQAALAERRRLEHELLDITEKERRRIGLDLHDDLGQQLSGIGLMTKGLELTLARKQIPEAKEAAKIHSLVQQAMNHTRDVVRDLAALDLKQNNLPDALGNLADHAADLFDINCRFKAQGSIPELDAGVANQLFKITQEALTNAIKHGKAKRIGIGLSFDNSQLVLTVQSNGLSFPDLKGHRTGMGLRIMSYRANLIGGSLEIKAGNGSGQGNAKGNSEGQGTFLTCSVPVENRH
jgi:PAS domain S-box-containing protein